MFSHNATQSMKSRVKKITLVPTLHASLSLLAIPKEILIRTKTDEDRKGETLENWKHEYKKRKKKRKESNEGRICI